MEPGVRPAAADVWRITTPLPFRPRAVHGYLARAGEGRWLLVDGGLNTDDAWRVVDDAVRSLAGAWSGVVLHVVTHMHLDHQGLSERVRAASGAPLAMGGLDAERSAHADADPDEEAGYRETLLRSSGVPDELLRSIERGRAEARPYGAFVAADYTLPEGVEALPQAEGWESVWTPGHTAGHVSLFRRSDRLLLAGDALLPRITPTIGVNRQRDDPVGDYLAALDRLEALEPARALAGHGDPIDDPGARIRELRDATREETERVAGLLGPEAATAWEVACLRHPGDDLPPSTRMLALRETLAHLQHLAALRRVARRAAGGVVRFWLL